MNPVTVIGQLESLDKLILFGHPISVSRVPPKLVGQRVEISGYLRFTSKEGAYLQALNTISTTRPDLNRVTVQGTVLGVLTPKEHPRHGKSACVVMQQNESITSKLLVTVPGHLFSELDVSNLSAGTRLCVTGYLGYHSKGLHVLFVRKEEMEDE